MQETRTFGVAPGGGYSREPWRKKQKWMEDSKERIGSALDAGNVSAEQSRVDAADHERKHTQQRHRGGADGVRAHKGDSGDLDREERNECKNVQPDVFHSSYLLNFLGFRGR